MNKKHVLLINCVVFTLILLISIAYAKSNIVLTMPPILAASKDKDRTPDPFTFTPKSNLAVGIFVTSNTITVSGINDPSLIYIIGGVYSIDGGAFSSAPNRVANGQKIQIGLTSPYSYSASATAILDIGGVSSAFTVSTMADTTPDIFTFLDQTNAGLNTLITSNPIVVSGITGPTPISISQGAYSINGAALTNTSGSVTNGQSVRVQLTSANTHSTSKDATLTIGGVSDTFTVTTIPDTTPNPFTFTDKTNVELNTVVISNTITVTGITAQVSISIIGGSYSINGGPFTSNPYTAANGQNVTVQIKSSNSYSTSTSSTLYIGDVSDTFTVTTKAMPANVYILPNHTGYIDSIGYVEVTGEVFNNTSNYIKYVKINANLFNSNGQLIDTDFTYTLLDNLPPGVTTCFKIYFSNTSGASYYQIESVSYSPNGVPLPNLTVYNHSSSYDSYFGWYEIIGMVRNDSGNYVSYVKPVGTIYNSAGNVVGCDYTYVNSTHLTAGQSSSFEMTFTGRDYFNVTSYKIQVNGN